MWKETNFAKFARNLPDLREIDQWGCKSIAFAKLTQVFAKFTAPFAAAPSVLVRQLAPERPSSPQRAPRPRSSGRGSGGGVRPLRPLPNPAKQRSDESEVIRFVAVSPTSAAVLLKCRRITFHQSSILLYFQINMYIHMFKLIMA